MSELLIPPQNFSMVCPGVYRSSYPTKKNFSFLTSVRIKTICYLCPEEYANLNQRFCDENGIHVMQFPTEGNKEPFVDITESSIQDALNVIIDTRNHPVLIHCNKGKHRTGALCGCLRKLQGWSLVSIFTEYNRFAGDKGRSLDQQFVELYRPAVQVNPNYVAKWFDPCGYKVDVTTLAKDDIAVRCGTTAVQETQAGQN
eukprot:PhF_6_TR9502/c0_g1_i1/m.14813/K18045/SIW14, OCA3; tyrosine-protein phosphatase SIW14